MKAKKVSATAFLIARSTVFLAGTPSVAKLVPADAAELCDQFIEMRSRGDRWLDRAMSKGILRPLSAALERFTIPGIQLHYTLRKRYLEEVTRATLDDGFHQVVILGAGFDTLALRLHKSFPRVQFIEVDHPATQRIKTIAINRLACLKDNLQFISLDVARPDLEQNLLSCSCFRPGKQTLFIAEGLMMYLAADKVENLFRFVRQQGGSASRFAFSFMETQRDGRIAFRNWSPAVRVWLRLRGEPFKWGIRREQLASFLGSSGFRVREVAAAETFRRRYLAEHGLVHLPLAEGECICVAESA